MKSVLGTSLAGRRKPDANGGNGGGNRRKVVKRSSQENRTSEGGDGKAFVDRPPGPERQAEGKALPACRWRRAVSLRAPLGRVVVAVSVSAWRQAANGDSWAAGSDHARPGARKGAGRPYARGRRPPRHRRTPGRAGETRGGAHSDVRGAVGRLAQTRGPAREVDRGLPARGQGEPRQSFVVACARCRWPKSRRR